MFTSLYWRMVMAGVLVSVSTQCCGGPLQQAWQQAQSHSPYLAIYRANLDAHQHQLRQAESKRWPTMWLQGEYAESSYRELFDSVAHSQSGKRSFRAQKTISSYALFAQQTIIDLPKWYEIQHQQRVFKEEEHTLIDLEQQLIIHLVERYLQLALLSAQQRLLTEERELLNAQKQQQSHRLKAGRVTKSALQQAQAALMRLDAEYQRTREEKLAAQQAIEQILGQPLHEHWQLNPNSGINEPTAIHCSATLMNENPRLKAAKFALKSSQTAIKKTTAKRLPTINSTLRYAPHNEIDVDSNTRIPWGSLDDAQSLEDEFEWKISLNMPLFHGGGLSAERQQAEAVARAKLGEYQQLQHQLMSSCQVLQQHLSTLKKQRTANEAQIEAYRMKALEASNAARASELDFSQLLQAHQRVAAQQVEGIRLKIALIMQHLKLRALYGQLAEDTLIWVDHQLLPPLLATKSEGNRSSM